MQISTPPARTRLARAVAAFVLTLTAIGGLLAASSPAMAADDPSTVGVATRPAGADGLPDGRTRLSYSADPGQTIADQVLVGNTGSAPQEFTVYATDAFNAEDGAFSLLPTADAPASIGAWVKFENGEDRIRFTLAPEEVRLLPFTVAFPAEATPGDHVGGLVASVIEEGQQVSLDRRVATAIYARVSGELQPQLTIRGFEASYEGDWWNPFGGAVRIRYSVANPGNVALAGNVTMGVRTVFGIPVAGEQGGGIPVLLPGNSATYEFEATGVGQWLYLNPYARLNPFVDSDDPDQQLLAVPATNRDGVTWAVPWTLLILLALAGLILLFLRWRRRQDAARAQAWMEYTEQEARRKAEHEQESGQDAELSAAGRAGDS
ncbi:hypothetical protein ACDF64_06885 [Agromyces sp. MMS24-JH15]|uniref:hypothetical protein n=1 Tax=Agromyces sp. MMS24-JH15 TaxID=3243765 RepID=UPI003749DAA0